MRLSIVIPTYNERENITALLPRIFEIFKKNKIKGEVIVVDDNSPDGTGELVEELKKGYKNLKVVRRKGKLGLSSAALDGFKTAGGEILGVMDADLSHSPEVLPTMFKKIEANDADFVIGSKYVKGGKTIDWPLHRKFISKFSIFLTRPLTHIKDPMSGFFLIKKECIEGIDFNPKGLKIGLEFIVKAKYKNIIEVPITFVERKKGKSKPGAKEYYDYLVHLSRLFSYKLGI